MNQSQGANHAMRLGKLIGNLLSLEMAARTVLDKLNSQTRSKSRPQLAEVQEGDWVGLDAFTDSSDLRNTLERYNKRASPVHRVDVISIGRLRDALAHGRMFGFGSETRQCLRLLKFGRKRQGNRVQVAMAVDMTDDWFKSNLTMLNDALLRVAQVLDYEVRELPKD